MNKIALCVAAALTLLAPVACATNSGPVTQSSRALEPPPAKGKLTRSASEPRLYTYTSTPRGFETNTYFLEGEHALVAIDTQFLPSAAEEALELIEEATHKPVKLAIVLHPNPDKFNGTDTFRKHGARVVTSAQVLASIPAVFALRTRWFRDRYAPDWPSETPSPESFGATSQTLSVDDIVLTAHVLGVGCSAAHVVVQWGKHVFPGDLVANGTHAWLEIGRPEDWLARLDEISTYAPSEVHPGRGASGGAELLTTQQHYLHRVIELTDEAHPALPVDAQAVEAIKARLIEEYPTLRYRVFLRVGMPSVYENEAKKAAATQPHT